MYYIGMRDGTRKKEKGKKKAKTYISNLFFYAQYTWPASKCIQNFKTLAQRGAEKSVTEYVLESKKNGQIKGRIKNLWLILFNTIQLVTTKICTKFQNPKSSSSCEIFDEKELTNRQTLLQKRQKLYTPICFEFRCIIRG